MNQPNHHRSQKLAALQAAISGNPEPLKAFKATQRRPYTDAEREAQRQYLSQLYGYEASLKEAVTFFGRGIPMGDSPHCFQLPNGMMLYF